MANNHVMGVSASLTSLSFSAYIWHCNPSSRHAEMDSSTNSVISPLSSWSFCSKRTQNAWRYCWEEFVYSLSSIVTEFTILDDGHFMISLFILISVVYCISAVWSSTYPTNANRIFILQKKSCSFYFQKTI